jgi:branched-chain amino acid transport system permease protein
VELSDYLTSSGFGGIDLITGLVFVIVVLLFRRGIWGTVRHQWLARQLRRVASRRSSASADPAGR